MKPAAILAICLISLILTACVTSSPMTSGNAGPASFKGDLNNLGATPDAPATSSPVN